MVCKTYILLFLIAFLFCGCEKESTTIVYFYNYTKDTVAVANPFMAEVEIDAKDWLLNTKEISYSIYLCPPNLKKSIFGWYEKNKNKATIKDTFVCYVLTDKIARTCSWDSISKYNLALFKYELSFDNLEQLNYTIPYPPNSSVDGMNVFNLQNNEH